MIESIFEISRTHCISICAFLVPANLLATLQTMIFIPWPRFRTQVPVMVTVASLYALAMVFHVFTWFAIGVVMAPTFILLFLASVCLTINFWAIAHRASLSQLLLKLWHSISRVVVHLTLRFRPISIQSSANSD